MFIDRQYEPWRLVAQDDMRPVLNWVLIVDGKGANKIHIEPGERYNGLAVATDGHGLVAVPVELEPEDVPGLVPAEVLKAAAKATPRSLGKIWVGMDEDGYRLMDQSRYIRVTGDYPDVGPVIPVKRPGTDADTMPLHPFIALNPKLLVEVCRAIGLPWTKAKADRCQARFSYASKKAGRPIIIEPISKIGETWQAPLGLLMPLYDGRQDEYYTCEGAPRRKGVWRA